MSSATDLVSGQGAQAAPHAGTFCSLPSRPEMLMDHEEGVGGSDLALSAREAQQAVSQAETLDEASSSNPSGGFHSFTSMRGGSNIDHSQRNVSDQSTQTGQSLSQAEAQSCAYFLTISETSLA